MYFWYTQLYGTDLELELYYYEAVSIRPVLRKVGRTVSTFLTGGSRRQLRAGRQIITRSQIRQAWGIWGFLSEPKLSRQRRERRLTKMDILYHKFMKEC